jgi:hypothetical protein
MASLQEIRQQYPQYQDMPDDVLADKLHQKFYSDMPRDEFNAKVGLVAQPPQAAQSKIGVGEDIARSALTGLGEGATQTVGLLGDVQGLADQAGTWVGDMLGLKPLTPEQQAGFGAGRAPTTAGIEKATGFDEVKHVPQTVAGKFARTGASFAGPAAVAGIGRGVVRTAIKGGVAPAVVSEGAGQLTEGTPAEPFARIGGAVLGGKLAAGRKPRPGPAPTRDALTDEATSLYNSSKQRGVLVSHTSLDPAIDDMTRKVQAFGAYDPQLTPDTFRVVQRLHDEFRGTSVDIEDLGKIREIIGTAAGAVRKEDRRAAMILKNAFDDFANNLTPADVLSGDPQAAMNDIIKARSLWARASKAETIEQVFEKARNAVGANYTAAGMQTALRQQFKAIANNPKKMRQFSKEEQDAIKAIVRGGRGENFLRLIGKLAPRGNIGTAIMGGAIYTDPVAGLGALGVAEGSKGLSTMMGNKKVRNLDEMVRRGAPVAPPPGRPPLAPWFAAKEMQRDDRTPVLDRNGMPLLDARGKYQYR